MGKTRALLHQSVLLIGLTIVLVSIGALFGIVGVLVAIVLRGVVMTAYNIALLKKEVGLEPFAVIRVLVPPATACVVMVAAVELAKVELGGELGPATLLGLVVVGGAVAYGTTLLLGDVLGLWPGYVRGAANSLSRALRRGPKVAATAA